MFLTPAAFNLDFDPEQHLQPSERAVYAARAKVAKQRYVWSPALMPVFRNCLIHLSANVPGKVAYFASVPNMVANRVTRTSPEMFLSRSLSSAPEEIKAAWMCEVMGQTLPELQFINSDDSDGWFRIYNYGPHSCMEGSERVRQYAVPGSDLALAYTVDADDDITHRVIVNRKKMTYLRIYGPEEDKNYVVAALNKAGFKYSYDTLEGGLVKLDYAQCDACGGDTLVGPYFDGGCDKVEILENGIGRLGEHGEHMNYSNDEIFCGCSNEESNDNEW